RRVRACRRSPDGARACRDWLRGCRAALDRADDPVLDRHPAVREHHLGAVPRVVSSLSMNPMDWRRLRLAAATAALAGALAYLHDPPWAGRVTSGLRPWEENPPGTFFRWTTGRASFFVP